MNDVTQKERPDWAPDDCPADVVKLIENDQVLEDLGVRGLASPDSKVVRQAVSRLKFQLGEAARKGRARGMVGGLVTGYLFGLVCGAVALYFSIGM